MENNSENNTAARIIHDLSKKQVGDVKLESKFRSSDRDTRHYAIVPDGVKVQELAFLDAKIPKHHCVFIDAESFESYVKDYASKTESRMFASLSELHLAAIIDYQPVLVKKVPSSAVNGEQSHIARFKLLETEDFKAWKGINNKTLTQSEFVEFLQERSHCVENPDQATILEVARNLELKSDVTFASKERRSDGGFDLTYREDINASVPGGKVKVPDELLLKFVAFEGASEMELRARMYFRMTNGKVVFAIKILNLRETILKTFREICGKISKEVSLSVHYTE